MTGTPTRILIVDDTASIRAMIRAVVSADPRLSVIGEAGDPYEAREAIKRLNPDVVTLDIEMPRMNGLDFLDRIMRLRPLPVVMISTRTRDKSAEAIRAMALGAVDCVDVAHLQRRADVQARLVETLLVAGKARVGGLGGGRIRPDLAAGGDYRWAGQTILIGSSTGGVDALERVLAAFPRNCPPTLIAQHMPASFLASFARRLDQSIAPAVAIAVNGEPIVPGRVYLAGGGEHHLALRSVAGNLRVAFEPAEPGDTYVPTVDRLFRSALPVARCIVAAILTGMGRDGAEGLAALRGAGARTLAQDAASCVIDGMPRAARELGAVERSVPLDAIGAELLSLTSKAKGGVA